MVSEKRIHYLCEDEIQKPFPQDHLLSSLDKPHDGNQLFSGQIFPILTLMIDSLYGPRREKTCLRGLHQSKIQTSLLSYRDNLEN